MITDMTNTTDTLDSKDVVLGGTPVETFLHRNHADYLVEEGSPIHPEFLWQCEFETNQHGDHIGEYSNEESGITIRYEVFRATNDFICSIQAPLVQWAIWKESFPGEFTQGILDNNPSNLPPVITKNQQYRIRNGILDTPENCHLDFVAYLGKVGERKELVWMDDSKGLRRLGQYDI